MLDLGDLVGVSGYLFRTKTNELTVWVEKLTLLAKALLPLPEKWHGLADVEVRYRQRYLDLIVNARAREIFARRAAILRELRSFFDARGYIEVETPMMHSIAGGAAARPFITHHNTFDIGPLSAHRAGAVPEAAGGRRPGSRLRNQPQFSQ